MKRIKEIIIEKSLAFSSFFNVFVLLLIIGSIFYKGFPALSWEMLSSLPKGGFYFGNEGGILNAIAGSLAISFGAVLISLFISLPLSLFLNVHLVRRKKLANSVRFILDILWAIPSIVYGSFAFMVMVYFGLRASLLAGTIAISLFIIPIMIRAMDEVMKSAPKELIEASLSLGSTNSEISFYILIRQCLPGIVTAILLAFGRGIGDAAAVLFTAGFTDNMPSSLTQPVATLPLSIFFQLSSPIIEVQERAYASAAVLTIIILIVSIFIRIISSGKKNNIWSKKIK